MRPLAFVSVLVFLLVLCAGRRVSAEPAWGGNCLSCHGDLQTGTMYVFGEDTTADPDESDTGAPDRGELKTFEVVAGQAETLLAGVTGLAADDGYAVKLGRLQFAGVENGGQLSYTADCDWAEWREPGNYYSDPVIAYRWPAGPATFEFTIDVEPDAEYDYYDLALAVAGKLADTGGLFYAQEHFYLRVAPLIVPGDLDEDGDVDLSDFATFALCYAGAGITVPPPSCPAEDFAACDLDADGDVDLSDFATFALNYTG